MDSRKNLTRIGTSFQSWFQVDIAVLVSSYWWIFCKGGAGSLIGSWMKIAASKKIIHHIIVLQKNAMIGPISCHTCWWTSDMTWAHCWTSQNSLLVYIIVHKSQHQLANLSHFSQLKKRNHNLYISVIYPIYIYIYTYKVEELFWWDFNRPVLPLFGGWARQWNSGRASSLPISSYLAAFAARTTRLQQERPENKFILLMAEILHQLIGNSSSYLQGLIHPRWCRISSINSINH